MPDPTFSGAPKTSNQSFDPSTDNKTPSLGSLNMKSMPSPTALSGTTGIDCSLIHGDEWNQIEGNLTENILKNHKATVMINETHTVNNNLVHRVNGTTNDTRIGVHNQTNIAPRNETYAHTLSETHHQPEHREQKTEDHNFVTSLLEFKEKHYEWKTFFVEFKQISLGFCWPLSFEKHLMDATGHIFSMEGSAIEVEMKEIKSSLGALGTEIKAGKLKAAATHLKAIGGNINAGLALNADSPFG
ncbi:hypothetical protein [Granulicella arctica]|uniref:Uncharacterized protein n=1 Tax=Granulicella arctica TaxID=940613 RepID=A0A7Y9TFE0_9BACT|nr:hypothetical protein [Granulicella arctica]NYF78656.1 hypothetical protein [Granulicella arctica]